MENPLVTTMIGLLISMALAIEGATLLPMVNLLRYPLAVLLAIRAAAIAARDNYETAKVTLRTLRNTLNDARLAARTMAALVRDILKPIYGNEYSYLWDALGFVGSLEIPMNIDELIEMLETIVTFLTANPAVGAARNLTVADVQAVLTSLKAARQAVTDQELTVGTLLAVRDQKFEAVRKALRGLKDELTDQLDPLDLRWKAFGFNLPGADATPDVPTNIIATLIGPTAAAMKWDASPRALYYRVWRKVIGVDTEAIAVGSPADLDFTLENLPVNTSVEISLSAVNSGGESARSEAITIVTH